MTGKETKGSRSRLAALPSYSRLPELRDWLTGAFYPDGGAQFVAMDRYGRQLIDPCTITVRMADENRTVIKYRLTDQGGLAKPNSLRATLLSATDGAIDVGALKTVEREDIWAALCKVSRITVQQDERDEAEHWRQEFLRDAVPITGFTLGSGGKIDALKALIERPQFNILAARHLAEFRATTNPTEAQEADLSRFLPAVLVDKTTGETWARHSEFATYARHMLDAPGMKPETLDGRLSAIGVPRRRYTGKDSARKPYQAVLYCLVAAGADDEDEEEAR